MSQETEKLLTLFRDAGNEYAAAKARSAYLDMKKKAILAYEQKQASENGYKTVAAQERAAYLSENYRKLMKEISDGILNEQVALSAMKAAEHRIEIWRTEQANSRMERKTYAA